MSVLGGGESRSARKEPPYSHMAPDNLLTNMENHIGENLIQQWWLQGEMEFAHFLTPGENSSSTEIRTHNQI